MIGARSLRGEDEVADELRIEAHEIKSEEGRAVAGDPGVPDVVARDVGEIAVDRGARPEQFLRVHPVFLGDGIISLLRACWTR